MSPLPEIGIYILSKQQFPNMQVDKKSKITVARVAKMRRVRGELLKGKRQSARNIHGEKSVHSTKRGRVELLRSY